MSDSTVKSARRALAVFEIFSNEQRPLTIKELSELMAAPQSSTSILVKSLVTLGYLDHHADTRRYYPTLRIAVLGTWITRRHSLTGATPAIILDLATRTQETVTVSIRNGIFTQYILGQSGKDRMRLHVETRAVVPLAVSAAGWVFLSLVPDDEIGRIVRRSQHEVDNEHWRESAPSALIEAPAARRRGFALSKGHTIPGISALAMLIPGTMDTTPMVMTVGGPTERIWERKDFLLSELRNTAARFAEGEGNDLIAAETLPGPFGDGKSDH